MKTKSIVLSVLLVCICTALFAQGNKADQRVSLARELYPLRLAHVAAVKRYEEDGVPNINYLTSIRQQNWAGSGMSKDEMKYYYREIEDEADPQPVGYVLLFIRRTYNMDSMNFFEEYTYDDDGNPLFWFCKYGFGDQRKNEMRGYFDADGTPVRSLNKSDATPEEIKARFSAARENFFLFKAAFDALYKVQYP